LAKLDLMRAAGSMASGNANDAAAKIKKGDEGTKRAGARRARRRAQRNDPAYRARRERRANRSDEEEAANGSSLPVCQVGANQNKPHAQAAYAMPVVAASTPAAIKASFMADLQMLSKIYAHLANQASHNVEIGPWGSKQASTRPRIYTI
jgi:hypothetical protein